jgi:hypothetical protein
MSLGERLIWLNRHQENNKPEDFSMVFINLSSIHSDNILKYKMTAPLAP